MPTIDELIADRDRARDIAVTLEQENHALRQTLLSIYGQAEHAIHATA